MLLQCVLNLTKANTQPSSVVDSIVELDLSVALDVLLSVDRVIMERSLSLLTKVLI